MKSIRPKPDLPDGLRRPGHFIVDDDLWDVFIEKVKMELTKPIEDVAEIEHDIDGFSIDGGGMVHGDEPRLEFKIQNCTIYCYARQVEFFLSALRHVKPAGNIGVPHIGFSGRWWSYLLSPETATKIADAFEKGAEEKKGEIDKAWDNLEEGVKESKKAFMPTREQARKAHKEMDRRSKFEEN